MLGALEDRVAPWKRNSDEDDVINGIVKVKIIHARELTPEEL